MQTERLFSATEGQMTLSLAQSTAPMPISAVLQQKGYAYINETSLFLAYFNVMPNIIEECHIDCKRANAWFGKYYQSSIRDSFYRCCSYRHSDEPELSDQFYVMYNDLIVYLKTGDSSVSFLFRKTEISLVEKLIEGIRQFRRMKSKRSPQISVLVNSGSGIETNSLRINRTRLSIDHNYNDDFKEVHKTILKRLSRNNDKGIVLLHGKPGTGKTSYIRYLIASIKKDVIFLPPNMASQITNPSLISMLVQNPNSIFVIEDAENIIVDRERNGSSPVSALLNISDGLLADCLNIQIICSFNTDISQIDSALMRKGRLIAQYEFKELEVAKAQQLSDKLGFCTQIDTPMSLAAIYNQDEKDFVLRKKSTIIGFQSRQYG